LTRQEDASLRQLYKDLLRLRRETPALGKLDLASVEVHAADDRAVVVARRDDALVAFNFSEEAQSVELPFRPAKWRALIDTGARIEGGRLTLPGNAFALMSSRA
jgi:glycosidase